MASVLVLPGAIGLGKHCRSGFFPKRLTVSDVARAAVLAVLGYRVVNYWLPLLPGALAYLHLRLRPPAPRKAVPASPSAE
jgi:uncharacterized membrane protein YbhN (UPF0104 family)